MIIFDEQLQNPDIMAAVKKWYPGTVTHIRTLRANSVIKDDNVPALLHVAQRPTFVTIVRRNLVYYYAQDGQIRQIDNG